MATVEVRISNALDDITIEDTTFADDEHIRIGKWSVSWKNALRFRNVTVPQGATITAAYITLHEAGIDTGTLCRVQIIGNDIDDAVSPTSTAEFNALVETTAFKNWNGVPVASFNYINTPTLVDIIQEIVDRGSWASGNAMQIMINDNSSDTGAFRDYESFDDEEDDCPLLHIEYGLAPTITAQAVTNKTAHTATGNGNITLLGSPEATQHGVCWVDEATYDGGAHPPTLADSFTEEGPPSATGAFTSSITGLTRGTTYYLKAYVTYASGTVYSNEVNFVAEQSAADLEGTIWTETTKFHIIEAESVERSIEGTVV